MFYIGVVLLLWAIVWAIRSNKFRLRFGPHAWYDYVGSVFLVAGPILMVFSLVIMALKVLP